MASDEEVVERLEWELCDRLQRHLVPVAEVARQPPLGVRGVVVRSVHDAITIAVEVVANLIVGGDAQRLARVDGVDADDEALDRVASPIVAEE